MEKKHSSKSKQELDFQLEIELPSNSTIEILSVSQYFEFIVFENN